MDRFDKLSWSIGDDPEEANFWNNDNSDLTPVGTDLERMLFENEVHIDLMEDHAIICRGTLRQVLEGINQFCEKNKIRGWWFEGCGKKGKDDEGVDCYTTVWGT